MPGVQTIGLIMSDYALQKISFQRIVDLLCKNPCKMLVLKIEVNMRVISPT